MAKQLDDRARSPELYREARGAGLRRFATPTLEEVGRRRLQLWTVTSFVVMGLCAAMVALSFSDDYLPSFISRYTGRGWMRGALMGLLVAFCAYTAEKEIHLRRLRRILADERVLTAAFSNRLNELSSLAETAKAINSTLDLDLVLGMILDTCIELIGGTHASVMMLDDDGRTLVVVSSRGDRDILGMCQEIGSGVAGWVAEHREPLLISGEADPALYRDLVPKDRPICAAISVPLVSRDELLGVLNLNDAERPDALSEYDLHTLSVFAEHAAIAIANARLYQSERDHVQRLLELDRLKSEFVSTVSHELRTPLTSILGSAMTLQRRGEKMTAEERQLFLAMIDRQGKHLKRLIEDILFAGRIEKGDPDLCREPCALDHVTEAVVAGFQTHLGGRRLTFSVTGPPPVVVGDENALQQVLSSLIDNALKHAPGAEPIEVVVESGEGLARVSVSDHGPGIDPAYLPHVFERFRQADGSTTRKSAGVGLGLFIARYLVERQGGRIWCESNASGTRFCFTLPMTNEEEVLR